MNTYEFFQVLNFATLDTLISDVEFGCGAAPRAKQYDDVFCREHFLGYTNL